MLTLQVLCLFPKYRTGYFIAFATCPVLWSSKMQTEVTLSTTEAEYITLSQSTQELIHICDLLQGLAKAPKLIVSSSVAHSTIFEDNKGCVELANAPRIHPCTCHNALKHYHFQGLTLSINLLIFLQNIYRPLILFLFIKSS